MSQAAGPLPLGDGQKRLLALRSGQFEKAAEIPALRQCLRHAMTTLLIKPGDQAQLGKTLDQADQYFGLIDGDESQGAQEKLKSLRHFCKEAFRLVIVNRTLEDIEAALKAAQGERISAASALYRADVTADEVVQETSIALVEPPPPENFSSFAQLFPAALVWRIRQATCFFQRTNPMLARTLPKPFMLSTEFDLKFENVVRKIIAPKMLEMSRSVSILETTHKWAEIDTAQFWDILESDSRVKDRVTATWNAVWDSIKQQKQVREKNGEKTTVLVAPKLLLEIRAELEPGPTDHYDIPPIRNREIELFASLPFEFEHKLLERYWIRLRQIYEQEMDRRWYQDKAREGALRDSLLSAFMSFPDQVGEFLALLCYYNFPNIDLFFLERFTHNRGSNDAHRQEMVPYMMRFIHQKAADEVRMQEKTEEAARQVEAEKMRREAQAAEAG